MKGSSHSGGSSLKFGPKKKVGSWVIKMTSVPGLLWKTRENFTSNSNERPTGFMIHAGAGIGWASWFLAGRA